MGTRVRDNRQELLQITTSFCLLSAMSMHLTRRLVGSQLLGSRLSSPLGSRLLGTGIRRIGTDDPRMSKVVVHNGTVYLSGQTAADAGDTIEEQTRAVLAKTDELLQSAGSSRSSLLTASIWLADIERDFGAFNAVWNGWVDPEAKPARATVESPMARPTILVEVQVTAAEDGDR